ncbi:MAG: FTR1 family protein [Ruminiclostridium sp.]|nr:FTR1 family protein [Ruminiclostridium sp.]
MNRVKLWLRKYVMLLAAAIIAVSAMTGIFAVRAFAEGSTTYIPTWDEYKEVNNLTVKTWNIVAEAIDDCIEASINLYKAGDKEAAYTPALNIYNYFYETSGFERNVNGYSGSEVSKAELQFKTARKAVKKDLGEETVIAEFVKLSEILHIQANHLDGLGDYGESAFNSDGTRKTVSSSVGAPAVQSETAAAETQTEDTAASSGFSGAATFSACFIIIVREGLEAILVVGAIIAYLVKSGNRSKLKHVYIGCVAAIAASFLCAWLLSLWKLANTANQEIIEGVTALIAVVVLFWVSNWMVSKAEADTWNRYIDGQIKTSAETGSVFTLAFTAFLAVFREGAEVILFYQQYLTEPSDIGYVWGGFGTGCVVLVAVFIAIRFFSVKLPIRPFFLGTSILMFIMSVSFLGAGIKELIEGDVVDMTSPEWLQNIIPYNDALAVLGVYPVLETLIPQLILILITFLIFAMTKRERGNRKEAGILAVVFGGLGIHKFYIGKYGQGIIYAVFCWSFIPLFLGIADGIHYLTETDEQFAEELLTKAQRKELEKRRKAAPKAVPAAVTAGEAPTVETSAPVETVSAAKPQNTGKGKSKKK